MATRDTATQGTASQERPGRGSALDLPPTMTANDDSPPGDKDPAATTTDAQPDDANPTVGIATATTDPIELDISVDADTFDRIAHLQLQGRDPHPQGGVSTTAWLPPAAARELGEKLIAAADEIEESEDHREAGADD